MYLWACPLDEDNLGEKSVMIPLFTRWERNTINTLLSYHFGAQYVSLGLDVLNLSKHAQEWMRSVRYHYHRANVCTDAKLKSSRNHVYTRMTHVLPVTGYLPPRWLIINYGNNMKASSVYLWHIVDIGVVDEWRFHVTTTEICVKWHIITTRSFPPKSALKAPWSSPIWSVLY